jgi:hypothetical protein
VKGSSVEEVHFSVKWWPTEFQAIDGMQSWILRTRRITRIRGVFGDFLGTLFAGIFCSKIPIRT